MNFNAKTWPDIALYRVYSKMYTCNQGYK